ncbi:MAG: VWA domain-containing protein, partial [Anaerolineales bacterium]|nr:VWA domain-containing protein [Anaerolineales bacterium]
NQKIIQSKISQISTGGATEIYQGLRLGITELHKAKRTSGISHLILLTDGHTYGDEQSCLDLARRSAQNMIGISALGIGDDWNDSFLDALVEPSGSVSAYLEKPEQVVTQIEKQLFSLNHTFAQDLQLRIELSKEVEVQSIHKLSPFPQPITLSPWSMPLGLLQHDTPLTTLIEVKVFPLPSGSKIYIRTDISADIVATGQSSQRYATQTNINIIKEPSNVLPLPAVVRAVSKLRLYQMNEKAWDDLKRGEIEQATLRFEKLGDRLMSEGQTQLAATAFHEAEQISKTGRISKAGRKKLKYGTRALVSNVKLS